VRRWIMLAVLAAAGCKSSTEPLRAPGDYTLVSLDEQQLPINEIGVWVLRGGVSLSSDGHFSYFEVDSMPRLSPNADSIAWSGSWSIKADSLLLVLNGGEWFAAGAVHGAQLVLVKRDFLGPEARWLYDRR